MFNPEGMANMPPKQAEEQYEMDFSADAGTASEPTMSEAELVAEITRLRELIIMHRRSSNTEEANELQKMREQREAELTQLTNARH